MLKADAGKDTKERHVMDYLQLLVAATVFSTFQDSLKAIFFITSVYIRYPASKRRLRVYRRDDKTRRSNTQAALISFL